MLNLVSKQGKIGKKFLLKGSMFTFVVTCAFGAFGQLEAPLTRDPGFLNRGAIASLQFSSDEIQSMVDSVDANRIAASVAFLANIKSRNSCAPNSGPNDPPSGIESAENWLINQYVQMPGIFKTRRSFAMVGCKDAGILRKNVVAWLPGSTHPEKVIVVGGHFDSRTFSNIDFDSPAPGANDSGSQTALVVEVARVLAANNYDYTIMFVNFSGEEQGMLGSTAFISDLPKFFSPSEVVAMFNFDIVGGDTAVNNSHSNTQYRLYAPTPRDELLQNWIEQAANRYVPEMNMIAEQAVDRPNRGSDQIPFQNSGTPAVRFIEARENAHHQHNPSDELRFVNPKYTEQIAKIAVATIAEMARVVSGDAALKMASCNNSSRDQNSIEKWSEYFQAANFRRPRNTCKEQGELF